MNRTVAIVTSIVLVALFVGAALFTGANVDKIQVANETVAQAELAGEDADTVAKAQSASIMGLWTIVPPLVAIGLAFITKQVVVSLLLGVVSGVFLIQTMQAPGIQNILPALFQTFLNTCTEMIGAMADPWNAGIIMQCLCIGGLIALITKMGGARAVAEALARKAKTARSATLLTWLMGLFVFFDDYANSLIVGPVMRPVTDKMKISREKLSFVVDATAAPIAGIALISTWIATELSAIRQGFELSGPAGIAIGETLGGDYSIFVQTIPYRFYNIFILIFIVMCAFMAKEFGPMLKAEVRARKYGKVIRDGSTPLISDEISKLEPVDGAKRKMVNAIVPVMTLVVSAFVGFYYNGYIAGVADGAITSAMGLFEWNTLQTAFSYSDASVVLFQAAVLSCIVALAMGVIQKQFTLGEGIGVWVEGLKSLLITAVILILAWSLTGCIKTLGTSHYIVGALSGILPYWLLPTLIFLVACIISFATGTSYGTMLIVTPLTIPLAINIIQSNAIVGDAYLLGTIGAVLAGAIFGDHCSPISDTTILSSMGAGVDHIDHVNTQMVYAVFVAAISILTGTLLTGLGISVWISMALGIVIMGVAIFFIGKNPDVEAKKAQ